MKPRPQWVHNCLKILKCCWLTAFYGGGESLRGNTGLCLSEAKLKMQVSAKGPKFDLVNSLGRRAWSQNSESLHTGQFPNCSNLASPATCPQAPLALKWQGRGGGGAGSSKFTRSWLPASGKIRPQSVLIGKGFLLSTLPRRTPDRTVAQCPLGLWQFYLKCNLPTPKIEGLNNLFEPLYCFHPTPYDVNALASVAILIS